MNTPSPSRTPQRVAPSRPAYDGTHRSTQSPLGGDEADYEFTPAAPQRSNNLNHGNYPQSRQQPARRSAREPPKATTTLFQFTRYRRVGAARLAQKKLRGFFKVYVADELHKVAARTTDIGVSDQRMISGTRFSLGLTGTLFGGYASSLFPILFRRVPEVRARFAFKDVNRWIDTYGIWERKWNEGEATLSGIGASTGIKRWHIRSTERAGVSPTLIRYLLPLTIFGQVEDLGYELPPFSDEVNYVSMTDEMEEQYGINEKILGMQ